MVEFITLPLDKIHVPKDRSREVDEDYALTIQSSIVEHFQFQPIIVRKTPNGKAAYTLVDGAHRYRAIELLDDSAETIDALIVKGDNSEAAMIEVASNIFRNELNALDRAMAVQIYRNNWEKKNGKIQRGGDQRDNLSLCLTDLISREAASGFNRACADRLGLSPKAVKRSNQIAQNIPLALLKKLRGTTAADNQSQLLKFAGLPPQQLANAVRAIDLALGNPTVALAALSDKKPDTRSAQAKLRDTCMSAFGKLTVKNQKALLAALQKNHEQDAKRAADKKRSD